MFNGFRGGGAQRKVARRFSVRVRGGAGELRCSCLADLAASLPYRHEGFAGAKGARRHAAGKRNCCFCASGVSVRLFVIDCPCECVRVCVLFAEISAFLVCSCCIRPLSALALLILPQALLCLHATACQRVCTFKQKHARQPDQRGLRTEKAARQAYRG